MSPPERSGPGVPSQHQALIFAALADTTRLALIAQLCAGPPRSITQLAENFALTRQAITKHLRVLQGAGIVHSVRAGRERHFEFDARPLQEARGYLERVSEQWDQALARLKAFLERQR